jgi:hypothetical protein
MAGGTILLPELTYGGCARRASDARPCRAERRRQLERRRPDWCAPRRRPAGAPEPLATAACHIADGEIRAVGTIGETCARPPVVAAPAASPGAAARRARRASPGGARRREIQDVEGFEAPSGRLVFPSTCRAASRPATPASIVRTRTTTRCSRSAVTGAKAPRRRVGHARRPPGGGALLERGGRSRYARGRRAGASDRRSVGWHRALPLLVERALKLGDADAPGRQWPPARDGAGGLTFRVLREELHLSEAGCGRVVAAPAPS